MITLTISNKKQHTVVTPVVTTVVDNPSTGIFAEAVRREKIVKELAEGFKFKQGDKVLPKDPAAFAQWGECTVMAVCSDYIHLGKDHVWPKNDNPMIVTASSSVGEIFFATTNYFAQ